MKYSEMNLHSSLKKAIERLGFVEPTPIQEKCIPHIIAGKDVVGQSLTGSGKTAAFGIPIIEKLKKNDICSALIITPTRELCVQVKETLSDLGRLMPINVAAVYGGVGIQSQIREIARSQVIVGTPGRLLDHMQRGTVNFRNLKFLVIDEADKMFEMGFIEDIEKIIGNLPNKRQTMLFSATMSQTILNLIRKHLRNPMLIKEKIHVDRSLLKHVYYDVSQKEKFSLLVHLLKNQTSELALVFCSTRSEVDIINRNLKINGIKSIAIHGGLTQNRRQYALGQLKDEQVRVLVATDVAARGLDIKNISHVYNYDVPKNSEEYVHRIGRTARMGKEGDAVTLLIQRDYNNFSRVLEDSNIKIEKANLPKFEMVSFVRSAGREHSFGNRPHKGNWHDKRHSRHKFQRR